MMMTDETTTEQLVEIDGQTEDTPASQYTPPDGWRVVRFGELLLPGDVWVNWEGTEARPDILHGDGTTASGGRYIRRIKPEPQAQPQAEPEPEPIQVREGQWRTRHGDIRNVIPTPAHDGRAKRWPWRDAEYDQTWTSNGRCQFNCEDSPSDLVEYLGPIKQQPQPKPQPPMLQDADERIRLLKQANDAQAETIGRLQGEARDLNMEIGGLERQLLQRDARIRDLETMHAAASQAVVDAGKQNDALRLQVQNRQQEYERQKGRIQFLETLDAGNGAAIDDYRAKVENLQGLVDTARGQLETAATEHDSLSAQLAAVKAELVTQAETIRRLQIELDAAQQVPADSPELRQLRADLAEVTQDRNTYRHAHELLLNDVNATHARTKAMTVEAIAEWLEPIRAVDHPNLANEALQHLPQIMRSLVGLDSPEDVD